MHVNNYIKGECYLYNVRLQTVSLWAGGRLQQWASLFSERGRVSFKGVRSLLRQFH